jgi:hypothetical protein
MKWTLLLEIVLWFMMLWMLVFQIIVPMIYRMPWFPLFRRAPRDAEKALSEAYEERHISETLAEAATIRPVEEKPAQATNKPKRRN